jgi:hypothetical protein
VHGGKGRALAESEHTKQDDQEKRSPGSDRERVDERDVLLQINTEPGSERPWCRTGKNPRRFEMPERLAGRVIEEIELARLRLMMSTQAVANPVRTIPTASAGSRSIANSALLVASDAVPRVNTERRPMSRTRTGMLNRPTTAARPAPP